MKQRLLNDLDTLLTSLTDTAEKVAYLNELKRLMHRQSPFRDEPVDCVLWVPAKSIMANDYNPNTVAPAEKKLLQHSLEKDGFTQPIVTAKAAERYLIVDGYHRHLLGKTRLKERLQGYLPVAMVNESSQGVAEQVATTIRHNRARGKHRINAMSDIVRDLTRHGWSDARIAAELGMDADEILRLKQLSGLAELFREENFSEGWTVE